MLGGEYVRDGGVVRDQLGRLVKPFDDGGSLEDPQEVVQSVAAKAVGHPKATLLGAGAVALVAAGGCHLLGCPNPVRQAEVRHIR